MKICSKCKIKKDINQFSKNFSQKDGYHYYCKKCLKIIRRKNYLNYKTREIDTVIKYKKNNPWINTLININQRCNNPKVQAYKYYGKKGIKNYLSLKEIKFLWFRDKAYLMKQPSIDRENNNADYTLDNCKFIELSINVSKRSYKNNGRKINELI